MNYKYNEMQTGPVSRSSKKTRRARKDSIQIERAGRIQTRASALAQLHEQQNNSRYPNATQLPAQYSMTNQRNMVNRSNQVLYPNLMHVPTSAPYIVPQQIAEPNNNSTTMNRQSMGSRYNTRSAVHDLPLSSAPTINLQDKYWNTPRTPVSQQSQRAQQISTPAPVECQLPKQNKEKGAPTELSMTADEENLINSLRAKRLDPARINVILENNDYVILYSEKSEDKPEQGKDNGNKLLIKKETYNQILGNSNFSKELLLRCIRKIQMKTAAQILETNQRIFNSSRAIQYHTMINQESTSEASSVSFSQNLNSPDTPNPRQSHSESSVQENAGVLIGNPTIPTLQQVLQQTPEAPPMATYESFPIPNIANFYRNLNLRQGNNRGDFRIRSSRPNAPIPYLETAAAYCFNNEFDNLGMQCFPNSVDD